MNQNDQQIFGQTFFKRLFSKLRMKTQIVIMNCFILILVIGLVLAAQLISLKLIIQNTNISAQEIAINEMREHLSALSMQYQYIITYFFLKTQITLTNLNQFYWFYLNNGSLQQSMVRQCDQQSLSYPQIHFAVMPCYFLTQNGQVIDQSNSEQVQILNNFTSSFTPFVISILEMTKKFIPTKVYGVSVNDNYQYLWGYPQVASAPGYDPTKRPWYINHIKGLQLNSQNNTQLSPLYKYYGDQKVRSMTMTQSWLNLNNEVIGIFASDITLENSYFYNDLINIMIVNVDGQLILINFQRNAVQNYSNFNYINQSNITGFNSYDWNSILNYANNQVIESNCSFKNFKIEMLCRYNSIYKQDSIIQAKRMSNLNYYLVLFYNIESEVIVTEKTNQIISQIYIQFYLYIGLTFFVWILIISLQLFGINYIFMPLYNALKYSKNFSNKQNILSRAKFLINTRNKNEFLQMIINSIKNSSQLHRLYNTNRINNILVVLSESFYNIFDRILSQGNTINEQCKILQAFRYPKQIEGIKFPYKFQLFTSQIKDNNYNPDSPSKIKKLHSYLNKSSLI